MSWLTNNAGTVAALAWQHIWLSVPPVIVAALIAVPCGWLAHAVKATRGAMLLITGLLYAIPSLPLFIVLPSLLGTKILDPINVVVALTIYALALLVRSAAEAFDAVDKDVQLGAEAQGFSRRQMFWQINLPLAGPVFMAGVRVAMVSTVSLVTVGSLIGVSSLGNLFVDGYQRNFALEIWVGLIGTVVIAVVLDGLLVLLGNVLMPWSRRQQLRTNGSRRTTSNGPTSPGPTSPGTASPDSANTDTTSIGAAS